MEIVLSVLLGLAALLLLITAGCFFAVFYASQRDKLPKGEYPVPDGPVYAPHREKMIEFIKKARALPCQEVSITSFDGLKLYGKFYEYAPGAPIELMFPGYRGLAERDLCGGVQRCFKLGRSALVVDQRARGICDGHVITFGIRERYDCQRWAEFIAERYGCHIPVILTGISMGAATVMMATALELPENVVGVIADCGYSSPKDIICKVASQIGLPAKVLYPFVKLGARLFGGFDLEEASPMEAMKQCRLPVFFAHGENDDYVPCEMTKQLYEACPAEKKLLTVSGAGHGLSYLIAPQEYLQALREMIPLYKFYEVKEDAECH